MIHIHDKELGLVRINPRYVVSVKEQHDEGGRYWIRVSTTDWTYVEEFLPSRESERNNRMLEIITAVDHSNQPEVRI